MGFRRHRWAAGRSHLGRRDPVAWDVGTSATGDGRRMLPSVTNGWLDQMRPHGVNGGCDGQSGPMKLYAESAGRRTRQIVLDLLVLAWALLWVKIAFVVHDLVQRLGAPGKALENAGGQLSDSLGDAANKVKDVPLAGDALRRPLQAAGDAGRSLADVGASQQTAVNRLALALALVVVIAPVLAVLLRYLPDRLRWIRNASAASRLRETARELDLFAIRALAHQPLSRLAQLGPDPAGAYLRQEPGATRALADLELNRLGLSTKP